MNSFFGGGATGSKNLYVTFAWSDASPIQIVISDNQTVHDAVAPYVPGGNANFGVIDLEGIDVTQRHGSQMNEGARVIVNTTGFVPGGA